MLVLVHVPVLCFHSICTAALDKELSVLRDKCLRQGSSRPNMALATAADGEAVDAASEGAGMDAQKLQKMVERTEEVKCRRDEKLRSE